MVRKTTPSEQQTGPAQASEPPSPRSGARTATLLAGVGAVMVIVAVVLLLIPRLPVSPRVSENVFVNTPAPIDANNSPTLARNPTDPDNVVAVHRVDRPGFSAQLHTSADGGVNWQATDLPLPEGLDRPYAPDVGFAPDGTLYVLYVNLEGQGNTPANVWLSTSVDGGLSLTDPVQIAGELKFQAQLAIGPDGTLHVTFLEADGVGLLQLTGAARIMAMRSTDQGASFSEPVQVSDPDRPRVGAGVPVVARDGSLGVLYRDFKDNVRDFGNLEGPPWENPSALVFTRSEAPGQFRPGVEIDDGVLIGKRFLVFLPDFPSLALADDGTWYAAWSDRRSGSGDVYLRRSTDGGASWSERVQVNPPDDGGTHQHLPAIDVAPGGRLDIAYYDRSVDPDGNNLAQTMFAWSTDQGASFERVALSTATFDTRVGPVAAPFHEPDFGTRIGLVSDAEGALATWTDTRGGTEATGRQDIVAARVELPALRAVLGWTLVAVVVVVLGLVGWRARRRARAAAAG